MTSPFGSVSVSIVSATYRSMAVTFDLLSISAAIGDAAKAHSAMMIGIFIVDFPGAWIA